MIPRCKPCPDGYLRSHEVADKTGASLRQLQYWDERKLVKPMIDSHQRLYSTEDVEIVRVILALRRKKIPIQAIRRIFQRAVFFRHAKDGPLWMIATPAKIVYVKSPESALRILDQMNSFAAVVHWQPAAARSGQ
jgi:DNA-binding transcriptional MerR regulator